MRKPFQDAAEDEVAIGGHVVECESYGVVQRAEGPFLTFDW